VFPAGCLTYKGIVDCFRVRGAGTVADKSIVPTIKPPSGLMPNKDVGRPVGITPLGKGSEKSIKCP
jgi:hypothetical protein